jgi:hypothetical protein
MGAVAAPVGVTVVVGLEVAVEVAGPAEVVGPADVAPAEVEAADADPVDVAAVDVPVAVGAAAEVELVAPWPVVLWVALLIMAWSADWKEAASGAWMFAAALAASTWCASRNWTDVGPAITIPIPDASRSIR